MQIKINWQNPNTTADGVRVYRSTSPIDIRALPQVYATLAGNATSYIDNQVTLLATYYYVLEVYKGADKIFSSNIQGYANAYSGPGPQDIIAGDMDAGYYGMVKTPDFVTWDDFLAWSKITVSSKNTSGLNDWMKFSFKGKVLFIARQPLGMSNWNNLYNNGLVFGVDGPGPRENNAVTAVNQLKIITFGNSQFKVRLPTALGPNFDLTKQLTGNTGAQASWNTSARTHDSFGAIDDLNGSEWNDLIAKMIIWTSPSIRGNRLAKLDASIAYMGQSAFTGMSADGLYQEALIGNQTPTRGMNTTLSYHPGYAVAIPRTQSCYWRPVLELIQ